MTDLTYEQLKEIALALNMLSAQRNSYLVDESNDKYRDDIEKFLNMDRDLLKMVKEEIDLRKVEDN
jgi:parvulin-like peptidyl-prolyl isomerase